MDPAARKHTLRLISNGIYILTSGRDARYGGATITWLSQASFKPPLLMVAVRPESNVFRCLSESGVAAVHILDRDQQEMAQRFFCPTTVVDGTINGEPFVPGTTRAPVLTNARAYCECVVRHICELGDHRVVLMEVVEAACHQETHPLTVAASPWAYGG
jgi:flavin reductase (DIM6/NTAB) family NADH-FMN oxidoreductase RutF